MQATSSPESSSGRERFRDLDQFQDCVPVARRTGDPEFREFLPEQNGKFRTAHSVGEVTVQMPRVGVHLFRENTAGADIGDLILFENASQENRDILVWLDATGRKTIDLSQLL